MYFSVDEPTFIISNLDSRTKGVKHLCTAMHGKIDRNARLINQIAMFGDKTADVGILQAYYALHCC